jgi:thiamine-phosphate pyrophosphorylase
MITCLITDRRRLAPGADEDRAQDCLVRQVGHAVAAEVDLIQVRERDLEARALTRLVTRIMQCARGTRTRIVVNERVDVALAAGADGVHLRRDSLAVADARQLAPPGFLVGRSVGSVEQAVAAGDADYLIAGTLWETESKPKDHPLLGIAGFAAVAAAVTVPVLAIGGVTAGRASAVAEAGGKGIAAIGLFLAGGGVGSCRAMPLRAVVEQLRGSFDTLTSGS